MIGLLRIAALTGRSGHRGADDGDGMAEVSPLFVLLTVMREKWGVRDREGAVALAKLAAPYMHGRAVASRPPGDLAGVPDEQLDEWGGDGGAAAAAADPE